MHQKVPITKMAYILSQTEYDSSRCFCFLTVLYFLLGEIGTSTTGTSSVAGYLRYTKLQSIKSHTEYFIDLLISSFAIKLCIIKDSFPVEPKWVYLGL